MLECNQILSKNLTNVKKRQSYLDVKKFLESYDKEIIYIGEFAMKEYSRYFTKEYGNTIRNNNMPTFVILHQEPNLLVEKFKKENDSFVVRSSVSIDDVIPKIYEIYQDNECYCMIIKTMDAKITIRLREKA